MASASSARYLFISAEPVSGTRPAHGPGGWGGTPSSLRRMRAVEDAGDVAGAGHAPGGHRAAQDLAAVEPGAFGFAQAAPQPRACRIIERLPGQVGGQGIAEGLLEPGVLFAADQVVPDPAEHAEVVGAGQFAFQGLGRRQFAAVAGQHPGQHRHRVHRGHRLLTGWRPGLRAAPACSRSSRRRRRSSGSGRLPSRTSASRGYCVMQ